MEGSSLPVPVMTSLAIKSVRAVHLCVLLFIISGPCLPGQATRVAHLLLIPVLFVHWRLNDERCVLTEWESALDVARAVKPVPGGFVKSILSKIVRELPPDKVIKRWFHGILIGSWLASLARLLVF